MKKVLSKGVFAVLMVVCVLSTMIPASAATTEVTENLTEIQNVVELVNQERQKAGVAAVELDEELTEAAMIRAKEITVLFDHSRPDGSSWSTVYDGFVGASGENIAYGTAGYYDSAKVMNGWMNSSGHRANILSGSYTRMGVGVYTYNNYTYWVQLFSQGTATKISNENSTENTEGNEVIENNETDNVAENHVINKVDNNESEYSCNNVCGKCKYTIKCYSIPIKSNCTKYVRIKLCPIV